MNTHQKKLLKLIDSKTKLFGMLAPSFPIDFKYPEIILMLKKLGIKKITELTFGARMVNYSYVEYIRNNPNQKYYIASPCPIVVSVIQNKYPELKKYLLPYNSPMSAMANIIKKQNQKYKIVFIAPCKAKQLIEAPKYKDLVELVITFKELQEIFEYKNIKKEDFTEKSKKTKPQFDSYIREYTKIYPISGGLAKTSHMKKLFKKQEILVSDQMKNITKELEKIKNGTSKYKFFDLLNCAGGCIGGPEINNKDLKTEIKKKTIVDYMKKSSRETMGKKKGKVKFVLDVDFETKL